jgi:S-adenosylmethionine hydrolase
MQIVSLTTDYGSKDYYTAELKATLLSTKGDFNIVDISHDIDHFDIVQASFFLKNALNSFPANSIHIVAVNCSHRKDEELIAFEKNNQFFLGPNNGIFSLVFDELEESRIFTINPPEGPAKFNHIMAHAAAYISHKLPLEEIGPPLSHFNRKLIIQPVVNSHQIRAMVIHIDHFENVVVNLKKELFEKVRQERKFELYYKPHDPITSLSQGYSDVAVGDPLAFFNSSGYLEIAVNLDKASSLLGLSKNEMIQINFY